MERQDTNSLSSDTDIIVYLDSHRIYKNGCRDLYIDFRSSNDCQRFQKVLEGQFKYSSASYLHLESIKVKQRLEYDAYYRLNIEELKRLKLNKDLRFDIEEDSYVIGGHYCFSRDADYNEILQKCSSEEQSKIEIEEFENYHLSDIDYSPVLEFRMDEIEKPSLYVADVGQANWNELRDNEKTVIVFDCGSPLNYQKKKTDEIWNNHNKRLKDKPATLVVSHWDIDHYHCLIHRENEYKLCFSSVYCTRPRSTTSHRVFDELRKTAGGNFYCILPFSESYNRLFWPPMRLKARGNFVSLYMGAMSKDINVCGLALFFEGQEKTALFSGDLRLGQCYDVKMNENKSKQHILIVPHHGGFCGKTSLKIHNQIAMGIISVGANNSYKHPNKDVLKYLISISHNTILRTDKHGGIEVQL